VHDFLPGGAQLLQFCHPVDQRQVAVRGIARSMPGRGGGGQRRCALRSRALSVEHSFYVPVARGTSRPEIDLPKAILVAMLSSPVPFLVTARPAAVAPARVAQLFGLSL
jgi:hypothetical protein